MKSTLQLPKLFFVRFLVAVCGAFLMLALAGNSNAQAAPGPITPAPGATPQASPRAAAERTPTRIGGKPILAGEWKLNKYDSDDPRQRLQQASNDPRNRGGWGGPGGPGGPGSPGGPGGGGRGGRGQTNDGQNDAASMMTDLSYLTIKQTETSVNVRSDSGRLLAQYPMADQTNSKPDDAQSSKNDSAQWQGDSLVIVTKKDGQKITRTFETSSDGSQLYLTTRMEGGHLKSPITFRLVYDPMNPPGDQSQ